MSPHAKNQQFKQLASRVTRVRPCKSQFEEKNSFLQNQIPSNHIPQHSTSMPYISARFHPGSDQLKRLASPVERSRPEGRIE